MRGLSSPEFPTQGGGHSNPNVNGRFVSSRKVSHYDPSWESSQRPVQKTQRTCALGKERSLEERPPMNRLDQLLVKRRTNKGGKMRLKTDF